MAMTTYNEYNIACVILNFCTLLVGCTADASDFFCAPQANLSILHCCSALANSAGKPWGEIWVGAVVIRKKAFKRLSSKSLPELQTSGQEGPIQNRRLLPNTRKNRDFSESPAPPGFNHEA